MFDIPLCKNYNRKLRSDGVKMNKIDLIESALYDELPYRKKLNITRPFGLEIEAGLENPADRHFICNQELLESEFIRKIDKTVTYGYPMEIASPLLSASEDTWDVLWLLSERMKKCKIRFDYAAFQVNMDVDYDLWCAYLFILFFRSFEHIIFKFSTSGQEVLRPHQMWAKSLKFLLNNYQRRSVDDFYIRKLVNTKDYAFGYKYKEGTEEGEMPNIIEFRIPNGSDDAWMWQNYVNTFFWMTDSISRLDLDYIDYELCYGNKKKHLYTWLDLDDACLFANIIFTNDEDKIYFLKQYIGPDRCRAEEYVKMRKLGSNGIK